MFLVGGKCDQTIPGGASDRYTKGPAAAGCD